MCLSVTLAVRWTWLTGGALDIQCYVELTLGNKFAICVFILLLKDSYPHPSPFRCLLLFYSLGIPLADSCSNAPMGSTSEFAHKHNYGGNS